MALDFDKTFVTDTKKEQEGTVIPISEGASLTIARFNNPKMEAHMARLGRPFARLIRLNQLENKQMRDMMAEAMGHHVLLGWSGMARGGTMLEYSPDLAVKLLKEHRDFFDLVFELANEQSHFRSEQQENIQGN